MLIRQPKHHLPIPTRHHIKPWIPRPDAPPRLARQPAHGRQGFRVLVHGRVRVPDQRVVVQARAAEDVAAVGAEGEVALAEGAGGARGGARGVVRLVVVVRGGEGEVGEEVAGEGVEEEVAGWEGGADEEGFAVVAEFEFGPVFRDGVLVCLRGEWRAVQGLKAAGVEGGEGGFVVVPEVVEEDGGGGGRGDGDHGCGGVVGGEVGGAEVKAGSCVGGREVPEADGVVQGAGEESVIAWAESYGGYGRGVTFEVAEELVVMGGEIADGVVDFGGGVQDGLGVVGEAGEVAAVFLGKEGFEVFAFFGVVELEGVIGAGGQEEFACVVEVEGCDCCFGFGKFEELRMG